MHYRTLPRPDSLCVAPKCMGSVLELAPVPLCPKHVRQTYEFGAALVSTQWATAVAEQHAEVRDRRAIANPLPDRSVHKADIPGYVYFIRFSDRIKIGWSAAPHRRIAELPFDEVLAIIPGTMQDERGYHFQFEHLRCKGEWFRAEHDLLAFVSQLSA